MRSSCVHDVEFFLLVTFCHRVDETCDVEEKVVAQLFRFFVQARVEHLNALHRRRCKEAEKQDEYITKMTCTSLQLLTEVPLTIAWCLVLMVSKYNTLVFSQTLLICEVVKPKKTDHLAKNIVIE